MTITKKGVKRDQSMHQGLASVAGTNVKMNLGLLGMEK